MNDQKKRKRKLWRNVIIIFLAIAAIGITVAISMFSQWSEFQSATADQASTSFAEELAKLKDARPYVTISQSGQVSVDRDLELDDRVKLKALHVLVFEPGVSRLAKIRFPFWFVKMKLNKSINLGTMVTILSKDWDQLDLSVTEDDLQNRGPGLVLDHSRPDGARILLWSE